MRISSRDYLRFRGRAPYIRVVIDDEVEKWGVEHLLRSHGAAILEVDASTSGSNRRSSIPAPDLIIVSHRSNYAPSDEQFDEVGFASKFFPNSRLLVISPAYVEPLAIAALDSVKNSGEIMVRTDQLNSEKLLEASRRAIFQLPIPDVAEETSSETGRILTAMSAIHLLTNRETEILGLAAVGDSNKQIAVKLGISLRTVNNHIGMLFVKLGVCGDTTTSGRVTAVLAYHGHRGSFERLPDADNQSIGEIHEPVGLPRSNGSPDLAAAA
jgi:DNA-binding CsgD family transcriptional regulator